MQVSRRQAYRAFAAVRRTHRRVTTAPRRRARPRAGVSPRTIELALQHIDDLPPVRIEVVVAASTRLALGDRPSPEEIADATLRQATCDRLR
jgi:hypothetical protein